MDKTVLVKPEIPENTGFVARLAENFDTELRIVDPEFNLSEARKTANKSQEKLRDAEIFDDMKAAVSDLEFVLGTKPGRGVPLKDFEPPEKVSLVLGPESSGLSNEQLELCDAVTFIETAEYSSINMSHAAAILIHGLQEGEERRGYKLIENAPVGENCTELLKRASPTEREAEAALSDIMDGSQP